ncbi:hypothetical protein [Sandaracinus amylolyticus]|uniref:hypothetical protein n=1 Tax=Sandaracinus amylolyticus TaxID=927083 RepID=UPI001F3C4CC8|nr:hypothetical protein [Sandaracinus amylolyticus]UJR80383.1 Fe-S oxidoreductase [Sandaracinus amylolyticus]
MREDLQRRISAALDAPDGIDGDPGLREVLEGDPQAAAYAHDVARLGRLMREWPLPEPDGAAFEALAARIEQRLDETLPRGGDLTAAPQFDDDDDLRDATAGLLGPVITSGEFQVEELESIPPGVIAPKSNAAPPPPPSARSLPAPVAREIPKLAPASDQAVDRLSFPSIPPAPGASSLQQAPVVPLRKRERGRYGWLAGLAAAAAVGLGVFTSTQIYQNAPSAESAAAPAQTVAPGATAAIPAEGAAVYEMAAVEEPAPAPTTPMPAAPMQRAEPMAAPREAPPPPPRPAAASTEAYAFDGMLGGALASGGAPTDERPARRRAASSDGAYARGAAGGGGAIGAGATTRADDAEETPRSAPRPTVAAAPAAAEPDEDLPATPDRGAVLAAIQAVEPAVRACAEAEHGVASVRIVVANTGRVTTATVGGQFAGTPVGSCVARAVRTARFPRFASERFEVTYPFQL